MLGKRLPLWWALWEPLKCVCPRSWSLLGSKGSTAPCPPEFAALFPKKLVSESGERPRRRPNDRQAELAPSPVFPHCSHIPVPVLSGTPTTSHTALTFAAPFLVLFRNRRRPVMQNVSLALIAPPLLGPTFCPPLRSTQSFSKLTGELGGVVGLGTRA